MAACQKDRSEYRWTLVVEYEDNKLASDEDNVKRIEKAEKAVPAKALKWRQAYMSRAGHRKPGSSCLHTSRGNTTPLELIDYDHLMLADHQRLLGLISTISTVEKWDI